MDDKHYADRGIVLANDFHLRRSQPQLELPVHLSTFVEASTNTGDKKAISSNKGPPVLTAIISHPFCSQFWYLVHHVAICLYKSPTGAVAASAVGAP